MLRPFPSLTVYIINTIKRAFAFRGHAMCSRELHSVAAALAHLASGKRSGARLHARHSVAIQSNI